MAEWRNTVQCLPVQSVTQLNTGPTLVYQLTDECRRSCDHLSAVSSAGSAKTTRSLATQVFIMHSLDSAQTHSPRAGHVTTNRLLSDLDLTLNSFSSATRGRRCYFSSFDPNLLHRNTRTINRRNGGAFSLSCRRIFADT